MDQENVIRWKVYSEIAVELFKRGAKLGGDPTYLAIALELHAKADEYLEKHLDYLARMD